MSGSNVATLQEECERCHIVMLGLCYPKARRNTGESEVCHGCRVMRIIFEQTGTTYGFSMFHLNIEDFPTMEHYSMRVYNYAPDTYPYVRAPLATTFNTVYNIQHLNILRLGTNAEESGANALGDVIRSRLQCQCVYKFVESSSSLKLLDIIE